MTIFKKCSFPAVESECPEGWDLYQDTCYRLGGTGMTQSDARYECRGTNGGSLVQISSEGENNFVKELLRRNAADDVTSAWIGIWHLSNSWMDLMEDVVTYTDWASPDSPQSPGHVCAVFSKDADWAWRETNCDEERPFVCERAASQTECFGGSCYDLHKEHSSIEGAHAMCKEHGGYVVEIGTRKEQNFVKDFLNRAEVPAREYYSDSGDSVWLGASDEDSEGNFYWTNSGTALGEFPGWADGEPNNAGSYYSGGEDCTVLDGTRDWQWNDVTCRGRRAVLCERPEVSPIGG